MECAVEELKYALIIKFLFLKLSINVLRTIIKTHGFSEVPMINFMYNYQVFSLYLANEKDYLHAWAQEVWIIVGCQFWLLNWSIDFNLKKESPQVAQWIFYLVYLCFCTGWIVCWWTILYRLKYYRCTNRIK